MTDEPETRAAEREQARLRPMRKALIEAARTVYAHDDSIRIGLDAAARVAISARPEPRPAGEVRSGDGGGLRTRATQLVNGDYRIEVELPCINGLSAWFGVGEAYGSTHEADEMTEGRIPLGQKTADLFVTALAAQTEQPGAGSTIDTPYVQDYRDTDFASTAPPPADAVWAAAQGVVDAADGLVPGYRSTALDTAVDALRKVLSTASVHGKGGLLIRATDAGQINRPGHRVVAFDNGCLAPILMEVAERSILEETHHA